MKTLIKVFRKLYEAEDMLREILNKVSQKDNSLIFQKEMLSKREAAIYMDVKIGRITNMILGKEIPVYRPTSNLVFIAKADLDEYMRRNRFMSTWEINAEANNYVRKHK